MSDKDSPPLYDEDNEEGLGYITGVKIHGKMEA